MTVRHVVTWKLKRADAAQRAAHTKQIVSRLEGLVGVVPQIRALSVGVNAAYPETNWDVTLIADFDSIQAVEEYQVHPAHQEVAGYIRSVVEQRAAVDFEL